MNRTDRLYALVEELRSAAPRARTSKELAERFEVSVRTIERDLSALQQSGVPIWATPGPGGGYALDPAMTLPPLNFTAHEATAIAIALARSGEMPYGSAAKTALRKLVGAMSSATRETARDLAARMSLVHREAGTGLGPPAVLRAVEEAVSRRVVLEMDYVDRNGERTAKRLVEPAGFAGSDRGWYLMAWCRMREGARVFRLDRIENARVTDEPSPPRPFAEVAPSDGPNFVTLELE